jgi:ubiquinone/menaquinone biosynthesis C-methylase UbiE
MSEDTSQSHANESARYWNEEGGRTWVAYMDQIETLNASLSKISLDRAMPQEGERILDVGCGGGATSRYMAEQVGSQGRVVGVDISAKILAVAKERSGHLANLQFQVGDAQTIDLGEDVFDLVYSRFGVMFFQDIITAFTNLHRGLKPTGRLTFLCWRAAAENPWMQRPVAAIQEIFPPPPSANPTAADPNAPGPFSLAQAERIDQILQSAGFTDIQLEPLDNYMRMGRVDEAMSLILGMMGPSADRMSLATHEQVTALHDAIRRVLGHYETGNGVAMPCAAWLVSARA